MNFCNFAKVIIGRNSKEPLSVNSSPQDGKSEIANKTSNVSSTFRYNFYSNIMYNYPKMHLPYEKFIRQLPRLQNYLTKPKYWKNKNKFEEKKDFLQKFSLQQWELSSEKQKQSHSIENCVACENSLVYHSALHSSASKEVENIVEISKNLTNSMKLKGVDGVHELLNVLEPIVEKKINTKLKTSVQQKYNLTEKIPSEQKRKMKLQITREN